MTRAQRKRLESAIRMSMPATLIAFKKWHAEGSLKESEIVQAAETFQNKIRMNYRLS